MSSYLLNLINYNILYIINLPTKVTDFDYDPSRPERRFISTLLHELHFYDKFTGIEVCVLKFSSEICYKIKYGLSKMISQESENLSRPLVLTIKDIYVNNMSTPSILSLFKMPNDLIQISILNNINNSTISFMNYEISKLIKLLENEI